MPRVLNTPVFILATVYFVVDGMFSHVTQPITVWLAKKKLFERVRLWVISLGPYPSLALFAVPVIILEPAKPLAGYLLGTGHFFAGAVTFITAEVLKLTLVEQLFQLNREKLLSSPACAWGYQYWLHMMDVVESMEVLEATHASRLLFDTRAIRPVTSRRDHRRTPVLLAASDRKPHCGGSYAPSLGRANKRTAQPEPPPGGGANSPPTPPLDRAPGQPVL